MEPGRPKKRGPAAPRKPQPGEPDTKRRRRSLSISRTRPKKKPSSRRQLSVQSSKSFSRPYRPRRKQQPVSQMEAVPESSPYGFYSVTDPRLGLGPYGPPPPHGVVPPGYHPASLPPQYAYPPPPLHFSPGKPPHVLGPEPVKPYPKTLRSRPAKSKKHQRAMSQQHYV